MKTFRYIDPFEKKDFQADEHWDTTLDIDISEYASQRIKEVLFRKNYKE